MDGPNCAGCPEVAELKRLVSQQQEKLAAQDERLAELEARLKINSSNSSQPPSSDPPSAPKPPSKPPTGRRPGGQPGHRGHSRKRLEASEIVQHLPSQCEHCQAPLPSEPSPADPAPLWHQVVDLLPVLISVTEHQAPRRTCPHCGRVTWGQIPDEALAHGFGPKLTSAIAFFSGRSHASKRNIEELMETLLGVPISLGSIINAEQEVSAALEAPYAQAQEALRHAPVKNVDETGWAQAGKLCWMWAGAAKDVAVFNIAQGRGQAQLRELLGQDIVGIVCSDRHSAYAIIDPLARQSCWAHLKRDFQKWVDWGTQTYGIGLAGLETVRKVFDAWGKFRAGALDRLGLQAALEPVKEDLRAKLEAEAANSRPNRKMVRFCRRILTAWPTLWTFARVEGVEPTNNLAERTLRPAVIWRKISFGNHSVTGCRFVQRILTTVQTLRLQNRPVLAYLRDAIAAHRASQPAPLLLAAGA